MSVTSLANGVLMTMHRMSQGGADRVAVLLANGFVAADIPTNFVLLRDGGEGEQALRALFDPRVELVIAGPALRSRHLELLRGRRFIRAQIEAMRPAVVLASSSNMGLVTGLAVNDGAGSDGPAVAMKLTNPVLRPRDSGRLRTGYRHRLYRFIFGRYDLVMTLTDVEREGLATQFPRLAERFKTVPNAYISDAMVGSERGERSPGPPRLLTLARMMPQKRLDVLLRAFAEADSPGARLTILGDGPMRPSLERLADQLGVAERVDMPGFVDDVVPWLRNSDLFVLSSDYEGLPAALIEALACGVPVVTTDCFPGARAMVEGLPSCAVTPVGEPRALARAIDAILARPQPSSGLRERASAYGIEASIDAHIAALDQLARRR